MRCALLLIGLSAAFADTLELTLYTTTDCTGTPEQDITASAACTKNEITSQGVTVTAYYKFTGSCAAGGTLAAFGTDDCSTAIPGAGTTIPAPSAEELKQVKAGVCHPVGGASQFSKCSAAAGLRPTFAGLAVLLLAALRM